MRAAVKNTFQRASVINRRQQQLFVSGVVSARRGYAAADAKDLKKTALYELHAEHKAKFVPYAGWKMPVMYESGMKDEHLHTRQQAGLFDVSHMGQLRIEGKDAADFLETLVPGNVKDLKNNKSRLTQFTNEKGGIMDDTMITRKSENQFYVVVNAGCCDNDLKHITAQIEKFTEKGDKEVELTFLNHHSLLALQGPEAASVLQKIVGDKFDLAQLEFMSGTDIVLDQLKGNDSPIQIIRCGYTGEDGFEISVPEQCAVQLASLFTADSRVKLIGLGARDTLRLEAGLCLMGSDMNDTITPVEAGLSFTIGKRRREAGDFPGAQVIVDQFKNGASKYRVGFEVNSHLPAREHMEIVNEKGEKIGEVTSGTLSPILNKSIAMGYVTSEYSKNGSKVQIKRNPKTILDATVVPLPFVPSRYYRKPTEKK